MKSVWGRRTRSHTHALNHAQDRAEGTTNDNNYNELAS